MNLTRELFEEAWNASGYGDETFIDKQAASGLWNAAIDMLQARLDTLEGIDKAYDAAVAHVIGLQKTLAVTAQLMVCGHSKACEVISAETGKVLYCGWCNSVSAARDSMTDKMACGHERACGWPEPTPCTVCNILSRATSDALRAAADTVAALGEHSKWTDVSNRILAFTPAHSRLAAELRELEVQIDTLREYSNRKAQAVLGWDVVDDYWAELDAAIKAKKKEMGGL